MEIKRISGSQLIPVETTTQEVHQNAPISKGIGETPDSFQRTTQADQFAFLSPQQQGITKAQTSADLLLEFQQRQFANGTFAPQTAIRTPQPASKSTDTQLDDLKTSINEYLETPASSMNTEQLEALQKAMAVAASVANVGPIIAAVLAAIAAVILLIQQMKQKELEQQEAAKEKEKTPSAGRLVSDGDSQESNDRDLGGAMEHLRKLLTLLVVDLKPGGRT